MPTLEGSCHCRAVAFAVKSHGRYSYALLLFDLPQDRRQLRLRHQSGRRRRHAEGDGRGKYQHLPHHYRRQEEPCPAPLLQALRHLPLGLRSALARPRPSLRWCHRLRPLQTARNGPHHAQRGAWLGRGSRGRCHPPALPGIPGALDQGWAQETRPPGRVSGNTRHAVAVRRPAAYWWFRTSASERAMA